MVLGFNDKEKAKKFMCELDFDLAGERKLIPIDWSEITMDEVKEELQTDIFEESYDYFVFCEIDITDLQLVSVNNKKLMAG